MLCDPASQIGSITTTGHSLGGALAALCAFDIAGCLNAEAAKHDEHPLGKGLDRLGSVAKGAQQAIATTQKAANKVALSTQAEEVYAKTEESIRAFCCAAEVKRGTGRMPPVTAVTFAAPRVGDKNFAAKFGTPKCALSGYLVIKLTYSLFPDMHHAQHPRQCCTNTGQHSPCYMSVRPPYGRGRADSTVSVVPGPAGTRP